MILTLGGLQCRIHVVNCTNLYNFEFYQNRKVQFMVFAVTILIYRNRSISCPATVANAATDGRYTRDIGIPTFGIGPFLNTPYAAHQDDEKINEVEFFKGIERYEALIRHLSQVPGNIHP